MNLFDVFRVSQPELVLLSAFLTTFIASILSEEQDKKIKNGGYSLLAGTSFGALSGLINDDPNLVLLGIFGSTLGAVAGWLLFLIISIFSGTKPDPLCLPNRKQSAA